MKNLTQSVYSFENLRKGDFLYVDKTEFLWELIRPSNAMYFFSRPRRFGKSLTLSTLEAIFRGKRELFQGLAIYDKPYDWEEYPVIHLDFGDCAVDSAARLTRYLDDAINSIAKAHEIMLDKCELSSRFSELISAMDKGKGVVVLVDEYDKPLLNMLDDAHAMREMLPVMKGFYSSIKTSAAHERFVFVTGVTKFCHVSLFSDLNNLQDISLDNRYATMLGYTQAEFESYFSEWIATTEARQSLSHERFLARVKSWYDGYRFEETAESVYNPVSLACFFENGGKFNNYWFATGTPSFLMKLIKQRKIAMEQVVTEPVNAFAFNAFEIDDVPLLTLLFQTGYVTIKSAVVKREKVYYRLDFPNREVSESFNVYLLDAYAKSSKNEVATFCDHLSDAIEEGNLAKFQKALEVFFAGIPYDVHHRSEANFQNIFFAIFKLMGYDIHAESQTSDGRIDAVLETDDSVYLFEFKLNGDDSALEQIRRKEYFKPYLLS